jgi:hypothetical protein
LFVDTAPAVARDASRVGKTLHNKSLLTTWVLLPLLALQTT